MKHQTRSHTDSRASIHLDVMKVFVFLILLGLFSLSAPLTASAQPTFPMLFAGTVKVVSGGALVDAPVGTVIAARVKGVDCAPTPCRITVTEAGKYGSPPFSYLLVQGTMSPGDTIEFYINDVKAQQTYTYTPGAEPQTNFNLTSVGAPSATPAATPTATPTRTPTVQPTATPQPSPTNAPAPSITPKPSPTPTATPVAPVQSGGAPLWVGIAGGVVAGVVIIAVSMLLMRRRRNI